MLIEGCYNLREMFIQHLKVCHRYCMVWKQNCHWNQNNEKKQILVVKNKN
jgi:hypothetical protein